MNNNLGKKSKVTTIITTIVMLLVLGGCIGALSWSLTGLKKNDSLMDKQREQLVLDNEKMKQDIIRETKEDLIKEIKDKKLVEVLEVKDKVADEIIDKKLQDKSLINKKYKYDIAAKTIEIDFKNNDAVVIEFVHGGELKSYKLLQKGSTKYTTSAVWIEGDLLQQHYCFYDVVWKGNKAILTRDKIGYFYVFSKDNQDRTDTNYYGISAVYF